MKKFKAFILEDRDIDSYYKNPVVIPDDKLEDFIKDNCQEALRYMAAASGWLFRGFKHDILYDDSAFVLPSPTDRKAYDTPQIINKYFIEAIEKLPDYNGVNRNNSFFLSPSIASANTYGQPHIAIPLDGFKYMYAINARDLYGIYNIDRNRFYRMYFPHYDPFFRYMDSVTETPTGFQGAESEFKRDKARDTMWRAMLEEHQKSGGEVFNHFVREYMKKIGITDWAEMFRFNDILFRDEMNFKTTNLERGISNMVEIMVSGKVLFITTYNDFYGANKKVHPKDYLK